MLEFDRGRTRTKHGQAPYSCGRNADVALVHCRLLDASDWDFDGRIAVEGFTRFKAKLPFALSIVPLA